MKIYKNRCSRRLKTQLFSSGLMACGVLTVTLALADGNHNHGSVNEGGRFTPNENGAVFPPQPRNATNIRAYSQAPAPSSRARNEIVSTIVADATVSQLLGDRYAFLGSAVHKDKWTGDNAKRIVNFFSHSWNQTVNVTYVDGGITETEVIPASEDQPALGETEKSDAIDIARAYWQGLGNTTINGLTGYSIQTFQADGSPFPTRMVYVSFHVESPEPPLLANWVDLTTQQVVRSEVAQ